MKVGYFSNSRREYLVSVRRFYPFLVKPGCECVLTWPRAQQKKDLTKMQAKAGESRDLTTIRAVAFTPFSVSVFRCTT